jgi:hypothetical protein
MMSARSAAKSFVALLFVMTVFTAAEARRAYQTVEDQEDTEISSSTDAPAHIVIPAKQQTLIKQDRSTHLTPVKAESAEGSEPTAPCPLLTSPVDCMMQFEKENHREAKSDTTFVNQRPRVELSESTTRNFEENKDLSIENNTAISVRPAGNQASGLPFDIAVTAIAIGVCCYAFSQRFLFRERNTTAVEEIQ